MEKELAKGESGDFGYVVEYNNGAAVLEVTFKGEQAKGGIFISVDVLEVLRGLAKKTDNKLDDALVEMIAGALGDNKEEEEPAEKSGAV